MTEPASISLATSITIPIIASLITWYVTTRFEKRSKRISVISSIKIHATNSLYIKPEDITYVEFLYSHSLISKRWYISLRTSINAYNQARSSAEDNVIGQIAESYFGYRIKDYTVYPPDWPHAYIYREEDEHFENSEDLPEPTQYTDNVYTVYQLKEKEILAVCDIANSIITGGRASKISDSILFENIHCNCSNGLEFYQVGIISTVFNNNRPKITQDILKAYESYSMDELSHSSKDFFQVRNNLLSLSGKHPILFQMNVFLVDLLTKINQLNPLKKNSSKQ